jgi:phosphoglycerate dehydrogenase-like enzyme
MSSPAASPRTFRIGVTRDLRTADGGLIFAPVDFGELDRAGLEWQFLPSWDSEVGTEALAGLDALFHFSPRITSASIEVAQETLLLIARHGVGLDMIDLDACTRGGVAVTITPDGIRGPLASAAVAFILALSHRLVERNHAVRSGRWAEGRFGMIGLGLAGRTLGLVGFGTIGREVRRLVEPWEMRVLVTTRRGLSEGEARQLGVVTCPLDDLLQKADVVVLACPLTTETYHLVDARRLALMKPHALLVNVGRGALVDTQALAVALEEGRLAGAGLDVFENEPVEPGDPVLASERVIAAPHALGYTDELFQGCVGSACRSILAVSKGLVPGHLANPAVTESELFRAKLAVFHEKQH